MKKVLQILLFLVFSIKSFAQMDTEHWFAPMYDSSFDADYAGDYLYLSTDSTDEFEVSTYSGNSLIGKVLIKKGNPAKIQIPKGIITTNDVNTTFTKSSMGLRVVGDYKFFANLRLLRTNHAEIINSKGTAGLGQKFYAGMAPIFNSSPYFNSQICIIATENNTKVKISDYNQNIVFINNNTFQSELNITLNKGESYIFATRCDTRYDPGENEYGLIGSKIESDKPVSLSNGNFNASYVASIANNDILMDQSVPVDRLGKEHILAKGNGDIAYGMERALVVATRNNTQIYINGSYLKTIDEGDYEWINGAASYIAQGSDVYDMYIKTSEDVYVYQFLAGDNVYNLGRASGGMNLIPSLNCFLPNQIVELPAINEIGSQSIFNTKVNIISQSGAKVRLNGELLAPYPVQGNSDWQLFTKSGVTGNVSIYSDKAVTAGIASGSGAVGFGGYFAGFNSIPAISKSGDCTKGQKLKVDDGYDFYRWYFNGTLVQSGANAYILDPKSYGKGYYKCEVTKNFCATRFTSDFGYLECPFFENKSYTIGNCGFVMIPVRFSSDPSMPVDVSSINIIDNIAGNPAAVIYDPVTGGYFIRYEAKGSDLKSVVFKYYFENQDTLPDSEEVTVTVNISQINLKNPKISISSCLQNQMGSYDLKKQFEPINNDPSISRYEYYKDAAFAEKIPDSQLDSYPSKPGNSVYVKVINSFDCFKTGEITLDTFELPTINTIDVKESNSVTINVTKGKAPYLYYIKKDGALDYLPALSEYSTSNNLPVKDGKGSYTVYVKSADDCNPVTRKFSVIGIPNVITPNDDGKNDVTDMSVLNEKLNPKFQIFNRNGVKLFDGSTSNNFIWNGKQNGVPLPVGTYWYILQWQDFEGAEPDLMTGWILLKNRN